MPLACVLLMYIYSCTLIFRKSVTHFIQEIPTFDLQKITTMPDHVAISRKSRDSQLKRSRIVKRMVEVTCTSILFYCLFTKKGKGAQWLSGRVFD